MTTVTASGARVQPVALPGGGRTFTVLGSDLVLVGPAEEFLEYLRAVGRSPNTVKSYARALALFWTFLDVAGRLNVYPTSRSWSMWPAARAAAGRWWHRGGRGRLRRRC